MNMYIKDKKEKEVYIMQLKKTETIICSVKNEMDQRKKERKQTIKGVNSIAKSNCKIQARGDRKRREDEMDDRIEFVQNIYKKVSINLYQQHHESCAQQA